MTQDYSMPSPPPPGYGEHPRIRTFSEGAYEETSFNHSSLTEEDESHDCVKKDSSLTDQKMKHSSSKHGKMVRQNAATENTDNNADNA